MATLHHTVIVLRHAKAETEGPSDIERTLTSRGRGDAAAAGAWLAAQGLAPDHALVSAAVRTVQTWEHAAGTAGWTLEPEIDRGLYAADTDTALDLLRGVDEEHRTVVIVGHNPTIATLAQVLDDGDGDVESSNAMATGFPTSSVAVFRHAGPWSALDPGAGRLTADHVARG